MWEIEIEDILLDYGLEAEILYYVYNKSFITYQKKINYFVIPTIIINSITGALLFDQRVKDILIISYILASFNIITAIMTTLLKFFNYIDLLSQCKILSLSYLSLFEDIKLTLMKRPEHRPNDLEYLENIKKRREDLYNNFSIIQDSIRKDFKSRHKDIILPLKLNHISKIQIYGRNIESIYSKTPSSHSIEV
jgi:hypothetical protein